MWQVNFQYIRAAGWAISLFFLAAPANAAPSHGLSMYGEPALPADFEALPYANPEARKGGRLVTGNTGGYDSLNPFVLKGTVPWQLRFLVYESLMGRNRDEPFALYGLLAESVETGANREWVEFTLRPEARFSDGSPVTVEDVIWSYETLGTKGHPRYRSFWSKVASIASPAPGKIRIEFAVEDRELALIAGLRPILKKAQFKDIDFASSTLANAPIGSSPYRVAEFEAGRFVSLKRNPDYWALDLPLRRGIHNFDEIKIDFYGDGNVMFEAFKAGELSFMREFNAENWATGYDFPRARAGAVTLSEIPHQKPSGMTGFVMNSRRALFKDVLVRSALIHAFNFEFINDTMTGGRQPRISSYYSGSPLAMSPGPASGAVADLLEPYKVSLAPGTLQGYQLPVSNGSERNRKNLRKAIALMEQAGWQVIDGVMQNALGEAFKFDVLLRQGAKEKQAIMDIYRKSLERLGVTMTIVTVDNAQYTERLNRFDFDMTDFRRALSLSPGNEQILYWGSKSADQPGSGNLMGMKSVAADHMVEVLLTSQSQAGFVDATRALDRILTAGRYVIPIWSYSIGRIAHDAQLQYPSHIPIYGDGVDWMPLVWWHQGD